MRPLSFFAGAIAALFGRRAPDPVKVLNRFAENYGQGTLLAAVMNEAVTRRDAAGGSFWGSPEPYRFGRYPGLSGNSRDRRRQRRAPLRAVYRQSLRGGEHA